MPLAVIVLPVPTPADANVEEAAEQVTTSAPITPLRVQALIVASVVESYVLLAAVTDGVTLAAVIFAAVVAVVVVSV